ncbi:MAG: hypothetical protein KF773_10145 [Deltaproteobacteria bacterium]|nr:hypothetical protein [Deltaproteobacteria bacterium]
MKLVGVVVVACLSGCLISPVMTFGSGKSAKQAQRMQAAKLTPPAIVVDGEWSGEIGVAKIRVYADEEYRAQNVGWQQAFQRELEMTNDILGQAFGVKLVAELHAWSYRAPAGATLLDVAQALQQHDPGDGVLTVVGLTSAMSLVASQFEQLGIANVPGRHIVLRGFADREERKSFDAFFRDISADERKHLYEARRQHKTTALFLHELAHNLGAVHASQPGTLLSPEYDHTATSFDGETRATMAAAIDRHLKRAPRPGARPAPPPSTGAPIPQPADLHPTLVVLVDAAGRRMVGGNALDDDTLDGLLRLSFDDDAATSIVVQVRRGAPPRIVEAVLERARAIGLARVSKVTVD